MLAVGDREREETSERLAALFSDVTTQCRFRVELELHIRHYYKAAHDSLDMCFTHFAAYLTDSSAIAYTLNKNNTSEANSIANFRLSFAAITDWYPVVFWYTRNSLTCGRIFRAFNSSLCPTLTPHYLYESA